MIPSYYVHAVCSLYIERIRWGSESAVAPILIDQVRPSKWGAKLCELCNDDDLASSGVCIKCDAGMCSTYFHATCAQKHGLLIEDNASPDTFYAHCTIHGDKIAIKKRVWLTSNLHGSRLMESYRRSMPGRCSCHWASATRHRTLMIRYLCPV